MKKILILTVTAGSGHNSAANAMKKLLESYGCEVAVVDMLKEFAPRISRWTVDKGYDIAVSKLRTVYNFVYDRYLRRPAEKACKSPAQRTVAKVNGGLLKLIYSYQPDVIYATSFYCATALANLKRVYPVPAKVVTAMLDYVVSPFWECTTEGVDAISVPDKCFYEELVCKGFDITRFLYTGIPVESGGGSPQGKAEEREKLGLSKGHFTVLVMFGGGNWAGTYAAFKALVRGLKQPVQIVVVNGHDVKSKRKIEKACAKLPPHITVKNLGFTDNVCALMRASDVMVGKGGGLTVTESVNCRLPLIATAKLPGQEYYNVEYLRAHGAGEIYHSGRELVRLVGEYYKSPEKAEKERAALSALSSNGLEKLAKFIADCDCADYGKVDFAIDYKRVNAEVRRARKRAYRGDMWRAKRDRRGY